MKHVYLHPRSMSVPGRALVSATAFDNGRKGLSWEMKEKNIKRMRTKLLYETFNINVSAISINQSSNWYQSDPRGIAQLWWINLYQGKMTMIEKEIGYIAGKSVR